MKKVLTIKSKKDSDNDFLYWQSVSFEERIKAIEILRQQYLQLLNEKENVQPRLQRVYRVVKKSDSANLN